MPLARSTSFRRLQLLGEGGVGFFEAGHFDFSSHEKSHGGDHPNFTATIGMMLAVLQVDHADHASPAHKRHRQERFVTVFWKLVKELEAWIFRRIFRDGDRLTVFRDPAGNSLPYPQFQTINNLRMWVF